MKERTMNGKKYGRHIVLAVCIMVGMLFSCRGGADRVSSSEGDDNAQSVSVSQREDSVRRASHTASTAPIARLEIEKLTAAQFDSARRYAHPDKPVLKITDFQTVRQQLSGVVDFVEGDGYLGIKNINFRNGTTSGEKEEFEEYGFVAYFPEEDILLCEGGHTTDVSFDLKTGQETYEVGNPDLITTSRGGTYRLNKVFEGQECFYHFIQKKEGNTYRKVFELGELFEKKMDRWLCVTGKEFWTDETTLYFGLVIEYNDQGNRYDYYRVKISG